MQRLVRHDNPEAKITPVLLLADLRMIDPTVELVYAGERIWWLGSVRANEVRAERGRNILKQMDLLDDFHKSRPSIARNIMLGQLALQGFALIEAYRGNDPSGVVEVAWDDPTAHYYTSMVQDFAERDAHWRRDAGAQVVEEKFSILRGDAKQREQEALMQQYLATDGRDHFRRNVRNRVSFGPQAVTGGDRILISQ